MDAGVVADDVRTAWKGITITIPGGVPDPSKQDYLSFYFGCIVTLVAGFVLVFLEYWGWAAFSLLPLTIFSIGYFLERKKYRFAKEAQIKALKAHQAAIEERNRAIQQLNRGYKYIGENYLRWIEDGIVLLRDAAVKHLGLLESEIISVEMNLDIDPNVIPPTVPQLSEYGNDQYPLPEKVGCTLYFVTNHKLIVVPAGGVCVHDPSDARHCKEGENDSGHQRKKQFSPLDLQAISQGDFDEDEPASESVKPNYISSYEIEYVDLTAVECTQVEPGKDVITMKLNSGSLVEVIGPKRLANMMRQKVRS